MTILKRFKGVARLKLDEGRVPTPYQDSRGLWTVGYGHNMQIPLSEAAMLQILADDLLAAETACLQLPFWSTLSEARQGALLNLTFNQGIGWVGKNPRMVEALKAGDYAAAATHLLDGPYATQVGARADRLAKQIRENVWV
jgi:lysozyme